MRSHISALTGICFFYSVCIPLISVGAQDLPLTVCAVLTQPPYDRLISQAIIETQNTNCQTFVEYA